MAAILSRSQCVYTFQLCMVYTYATVHCESLVEAEHYLCVYVYICLCACECMLPCIHDYMYVFYVCSFYVCWFYDVFFTYGCLVRDDLIKKFKHNHQANFRLRLLNTNAGLRRAKYWIVKHCCSFYTHVKCFMESGSNGLFLLCLLLWDSYTSIEIVWGICHIEWIGMPFI